MSVLDEVNSPKDLKKLNNKQLEELCSDIRTFLVDKVSKTGGHLASNLGVVELTVAMHKVFNSPKDQFVFDVGHQCYTHKILTGRKDEFDSLRQEGGISGFTRPDENDNDIFSSGHSSTSISAAIGLAKAKQLKGEKGKVIAVIGDGALTGGLAYEGLNNAGRDVANLIVILNDNNMSISQNVGTMAKNLTAIRTSKRYITFRSKIRRNVVKIPSIGPSLSTFITACTSKIRKKVYKQTFFEDLGFRYYGPIDGHDIDGLINVLNAAKAHHHPVLIHINTTKGKGYKPAEENPTLFHGIGKFNAQTGEPLSKGTNFSNVFGEALCNFADNDSRICAVTAAMAEGTGLGGFAQKYPNRFFDVGIAEQHAVTFSSGLAKNGLIPVFAVYSTFLQRAYDQLVHDVSMQDLKIIIGVDRAGFVGEDGESHHGLLDTSYLNSIINMTILAPSFYDELSAMLYEGIYKVNGAVAIRYPRGGEQQVDFDYEYNHTSFSIFGDENAKNCIVCYGRVFQNAYNALKKLDDTFIVKLNKIKPIDDLIFEKLKNTENIFFFEEAIRSGSVGESFGSRLDENGINAIFKHIAINDEFVKHASVDSQMKKYHLDTQSIIDEVKNAKS